MSTAGVQVQGNLRTQNLRKFKCRGIAEHARGCHRQRRCARQGNVCKHVRLRLKSIQNTAVRRNAVSCARKCKFSVCPVKFSLAYTSFVQTLHISLCQQCHVLDHISMFTSIVFLAQRCIPCTASPRNTVFAPRISSACSGSCKPRTPLHVLVRTLYSCPTLQFLVRTAFSAHKLCSLVRTLQFFVQKHCMFSSEHRSSSCRTLHLLVKTLQFLVQTLHFLIQIVKTLHFRANSSSVAF